MKAVDELFEMTKGRKWGRNNDKRLVIVPKLKADRSRLMRIVMSRAAVDPEIHFAFTFKQMMMMALLIRNSLAALINYVLGPYAASQ